uniref:Uncharacterized protein n=1 Tax=Acinetobacter phage vB_AbaSt_W16 TaxID=3116434 RepID=A0AB38ZCY4_9CAUD
MSLRTEPKNFEEMYAWGMISAKVYTENKHRPNAMEYVRQNALTYDYFTFSKPHLDEYFTENKIDIMEMDEKFFIHYVMKLTQGKINPNVVSSYYKERQSST